MSSLLGAGLAALLALGAAHDVRTGTEGAPAARAATTRPRAELVRTVPISKPPGASRVVISLSPAELGSLQPGTALRLAGEVQVSLTCIDPSLPRCIGRTYRFSPLVTGQLVLAGDAAGTSPSTTLPLGSPRSVRCRAEPIPNRNHHCVLTFDEEATLPDASEMPCTPDSCFVNLALRATAPRAVAGDRLVIGADERTGAVRRNKGRLAAVVIPPGAQPTVSERRSTHVRHEELPEQQDGGLRVAYSVKLPSLAAGDVIAATARQTTDIHDLPYAAYVSDQLILARSPNAVRPAQPDPAFDSGYLTASNGFNCTHGASAYRTPCVARKAGALAVVATPADGPYYVNLVSRSKPKHSTGQAGDFARVLPRGFLDVTRYR